MKAYTGWVEKTCYLKLENQLLDFW